MDNFDWVTALAECSVGQIFERLKSQIKEDVAKRQSLRPSQAYFGFSFISNGREFSVLIEGNNLHRAVTFSVGVNSIIVRDENDTLMFKAFPTVCNDGECRLKVDGQERELWQVRKQALEGLFFSPEAQG